MDAQLQRLCTEAIPLVHHECSHSVFWELSPKTRAGRGLDVAFEKEAWLATGLLEGVCGGYNLVYQRKGVPPIRAIATILYCPPAYAPGAAIMPTAPVSSDAQLISSLHIDPVIAATGLEAVMLDAVIMDLVAAEIPAVEAFGIRPDAPVPPEAADIVAEAATAGLVEVNTLEAAGFKVMADHPVLPRLRMELPPARELLTLQELADLFNRICV